MNFHRIASLKAGYKLNIQMKGTSVSEYMSVSFARKLGMSFEFAPKLSFQGGTVFVNDYDIKFYPQAMKDNIPEDFISMFDFAQLVLSENFMNMLLTAEIEKKGKDVIYKKDGYTVKIDSNSGMFKEFSEENKFCLKLGTYKNFMNISKIPASAVFEAKEAKFKCECILNKSSILTPAEIQKFLGQFQNDSKSSGQN